MTKEKGLVKANEANVVEFYLRSEDTILLLDSLQFAYNVMEASGAEMMKEVEGEELDESDKKRAMNLLIKSYAIKALHESILRNYTTLDMDEKIDPNLIN